MDDMAIFSAARCRIDFPRFRSSGEQHLASGGAGFAQPIPFAPRTRAAARHLDSINGVVVGRVHRRGFDANLGPIGIQFFGNSHRTTRVSALAHLTMVTHDDHAAVLTDAEKRVRNKGRGRLFCGFGRAVESGKINAEDQTSARERARFEKTAAAEIEDCVHWPPPFAFNCAAR